jgi:hypothetical protein
MVLYETALLIFQIELLSVFLQSTEEFQQGGLLGLRQSTNPFSQLVLGSRDPGSRPDGAVRSGCRFTLSRQEPLQINVEGVGIELRSNRCKGSLAAFVGGIVRPSKGRGYMVGPGITSALTRSLKTLGYSTGGLRGHA